MATITVPRTRLYDVSVAEFGIRQSVFLSTSPTDGSTRTVEVPGARWVMTLTFPAQFNTDRAYIEALFASLRAQSNRLSMGHPLRREPRGTLRGSPTLGATASAGATTVNINQSGSTVYAGDMIGVGGELKMVTEDRLSGLTSVPITPPMRGTFNAGTAVTWDWPATLWIVNGDSVRVPLGPVTSPQFSVDLVEVFA